MIDDIQEYERMERNVRGAIRRHLARCARSELAPAARPRLIDHFATTTPAVIYLAEWKLSMERLTTLVIEEMAALLSSSAPAEGGEHGKDQR